MTLSFLEPFADGGCKSAFFVGVPMNGTKPGVVWSTKQQGGEVLSNGFATTTTQHEAEHNDQECRQNWAENTDLVLVVKSLPDMVFKTHFLLLREVELWDLEKLDLLINSGQIGFS
jgi:hypothetical protein